MVSVRGRGLGGTEGTVEPFLAHRECSVSPAVSGSTHQGLTKPAQLRVLRTTQDHLASPRRRARGCGGGYGSPAFSAPSAGGRRGVPRRRRRSSSARALSLIHISE